MTIKTTRGKRYVIKSTSDWIKCLQWERRRQKKILRHFERVCELNAAERRDGLIQ